MEIDFELANEIYKKSEELNKINNPKGFYHIHLTNLKSVLKQSFQGHDFAKIKIELKEDSRTRDIIFLNKDVNNLKSNCSLIKWISELPTNDENRKKNIFNLAVDGYLLREAESRLGLQDFLGFIFEQGFSNISNYIDHKEADDSKPSVGSSSLGKKKSKRNQESIFLKHKMDEYYKSIEILENELKKVFNFSFDNRLLKFIIQVNKLRIGMRDSSISSPIFLNLFNELKIVYSSNISKTVLSMNGLLLILFDNQFTTKEEWENRMGDFAEKNPLYIQFIRREIFRFISYKE